jgi:hypothetical protein
LDPDQWPEPDRDAITDKAAFEREVADRLASMLRNFDPEKGQYAISLAGSYPDTKIKVSGRNIRTREPTDWEFDLWELWQPYEQAEGTAVVVYAQLAV